jgi:hypothetical protein
VRERGLGGNRTALGEWRMVAPFDLSAFYRIYLVRFSDLVAEARTILPALFSAACCSKISQTGRKRNHQARSFGGRNVWMVNDFQEISAKWRNREERHLNCY